MDGKGRALDNAFIERFWRSLKQEKIYLYAYENGWQLEQVITEYMAFYNYEPHQSLDYKTPMSQYAMEWQPKNYLHIHTTNKRKKKQKRKITITNSFVLINNCFN